MSKFEIKLDVLESKPVERTIEPSVEELEAIFESFDDDFHILPDEDVHIDLYADLDGSTVLVSGKVTGTVGYTCGRCLTERTLDIEAPMNFTVMSRAEWEESYEDHEEVALETEDLDATWYEGNSVDVRPLVRDAVIMDLPAWPQCPDELRDSCDAAYQEHIGEETVDKLEKHSVDLRWWPLRDIDLEDDEQEESN